jgi:hypothetical protein
VEWYAEFLRGITAEVLLDEGRSEPIKAGGHCRVGGEEVPRSRDGQRDIEGLRGLLHETAGALQHGKGRMTFVQMTDFRLDAECGEQPPAANPQNQFLLKAQLGPAAIQLAGDPSMRGKVCQARSQTEAPGKAISNRNHSPFAWRNGVIGNCPGSLYG